VSATQLVSSWGRLTRAPHTIIPLRERGDVHLARGAPGQAGLPFGNGRSYGDVCLNPAGTLWTTRGLDRFIAFDADVGTIDCEAGVLLREIIEVALPHGWFLPVSPGTQFVTLGGAIANDVHGKNHHRGGTIGEHVESLQLQRTDGSRIACGPVEARDWFCATVGGLGLTGVIVSARLRLKRVPGPWIDVDTRPFASLAEFFRLSQASELDWEHTVAWVDCCGGSQGRRRGLLFRGNHMDQPALSTHARTIRLPVSPPFSLINSLSLRAFNQVYFHLNRMRAGRQIKHYRPFFYPLDNVLEWNRIYGPRGFYQYQCVVPAAVELEATGELLDTISASGTGSFLAVLKTFGDRTPLGLLSFPIKGTTLALDFPNLGDRTLKLFDRLNAVVRNAGGRIYAAKDASMPREMFERGYPRLAEFARYRDPGISSAMSRRLTGS